MPGGRRPGGRGVALAIHGPFRLAACGGEAKVCLACRAAAVRAAVALRFAGHLRGSRHRLIRHR